MKKELRPVHENVACEICGRTILKGERTESYLAPGGRRHQVCELCFESAEQHGWIRETAAGDSPARVPRQEPRRPLLSRLRRRAGARHAEHPPEEQAPLAEPESGPGHDAEWPNGAEPVAADSSVEVDAGMPPRRRELPKEPRHVRAVPTTAQVKIERALELFNGSEHQHTIAGLARTLGAPWVSAAPDEAQPSAVDVVVAWELSWYRFRIDLGDEAAPVALLEKGEQLDEIDGPKREWNAAMDPDGRLLPGHAMAGEGTEQ
ncbi:MAG: hypothetical protein ABR581_08595 [Thermoleophilaceae bacterium]